MAVRLSILCIFFALFLTSSIFAQRYSQYGRNYDRDMEELRYEAEKRYLEDCDDVEIYRYSGNTTISRHEEINGHVVVTRGDLHVRGEVNGDIIIIMGDAKVYSRGIVRGNVTTVDGVVHLYHRGRVTGNMLETHERNIAGRDRYIRRRFSSYHRYRYRHRENYGTLRMPHYEENVAIRYNRVEGLFLGLEVPKNLNKRSNSIDLYGFGGYGFSNKKFRYQLGLQRWLFDPVDFRTEIGFEFHDLTDTKDLWRIGYLENSLAAAFLKEDYHDYYRRKGYSFHTSQNISRFLQIRGEYRSDEYESMLNTVDWALFRGDESFRANPLLEEDAGIMNSIYGQVLVDTRNEIENPRKGVYFRLTGETSHSGIGGDFDFNRYTAEVRLHQPISRREGLMLRLLAGTSEGNLPIQHNFELGGLSTLRAYPFKSLVGNRMFLANVEYLLSPDIFDNFLGIDDINFILFTDAGNAWTGSGSENIIDSFQPWRWDRLKTNVGIGIADEDDYFRVNFAKRTDRSEDDIVVTFRIRQPF